MAECDGEIRALEINRENVAKKVAECEAAIKKTEAKCVQGLGDISAQAHIVDAIMSCMRAVRMFERETLLSAMSFNQRGMLAPFVSRNF